MSDSFVDIIRHGQVEGEEVFRGSQDDPLTEAGFESMKGTLTFRGEWDVVYTSPLSRCQEFAQWFAADQTLPLVVDERLREIDFGQWEGLSTAEVMERDRARLEALWDDPEKFTFPGGEKVSEFRHRVLDVFDHIVAQTFPGRSLVVTHGGVIRMVIADLLSIGPEAFYRLEVAPAAMSRIRIAHNEGKLDGRGHSLVFHGLGPL